jgi:hypothetical protein
MTIKEDKAGEKTGEARVRQGAKRSQVEHLASIRNAAWRAPRQFSATN